MAAKKVEKMLLTIIIIIVVGIIAIVGAFGIAYVVGSRDIVSPIQVINDSGNKTALLVYQPGCSSLPKDVSYGFADGLASNGWRVEITTASPEAPSELSNYSLLVLAWPIYGGAAGEATVRYVERIGDLNGMQTVLIATGGGKTGFDTMTQKVQAANGAVIDTVAPKDLGSAAVETARQAGAQIQPR